MPSKTKPNQEPLNKLYTQDLNILKPKNLKNYTCEAEKPTCVTGRRCRKLDVDGTTVLCKGKVYHELYRLNRRLQTPLEQQNSLPIHVPSNSV